MSHSIILRTAHCINAPLGFLKDSAIPRKVCDSWTCGMWIEAMADLNHNKRPTLSSASWKDDGALVNAGVLLCVSSATVIIRSIRVEVVFGPNKIACNESPFLFVM